MAIYAMLTQAMNYMGNNYIGCTYVGNNYMSAITIDAITRRYQKRPSFVVAVARHGKDVFV